MAIIPTRKDNLVIENIRPSIEGGRFMLKREPGDTVTLTADIFRHSHEKYDAAIISFKSRIPMVFYFLSIVLLLTTFFFIFRAKQ